MTLSLPLIVTLIIVAVLTAGGMAVRSVSRIWLRHWAERQLRGAAAAVTYLERPHRLLTAANIGVALTLLIAGLFLGAAERGIGVAWSSLAFAGFDSRRPAHSARHRTAVAFGDRAVHPADPSLHGSRDDADHRRRTSDRAGVRQGKDSRRAAAGA